MKSRDWFDDSDHFDRLYSRADTQLEQRCERGWVIFCAFVVALAFLCAQVTS